MISHTWAGKDLTTWDVLQRLQAARQAYSGEWNIRGVLDMLTDGVTSPQAFCDAIAHVHAQVSRTGLSLYASSPSPHRTHPRPPEAPRNKHRTWTPPVSLPGLVTFCRPAVPSINGALSMSPAQTTPPARARTKRTAATVPGPPARVRPSPGIGATESDAGPGRGTVRVPAHDLPRYLASRGRSQLLRRPRHASDGG